MFKSLLLTMVFFLTSATAPLATKVDGALPGDPFYRIERVLEEIQLKNARTPEERVQLRLLFMQERLQETQALLERGDAANLSIALDGVGDSLEGLEEETLQADPNNDGSVIEIVDEVFDGPEYSPEAVHRDFYCENREEFSHPVGVRFAELYEEAEYGDVMDWFCSGYGMGEVKLAYQISEKAQEEVGELFAMRELGMGWGQIMHLVERIDDIDAIEDPDPEATQELEETEEIDETPEPEESEEGDGPDDPGNDELTEDGDPEVNRVRYADEEGFCVGADPHPTGERLAQEYGVDYTEIMTYFCEGFGFGEIMLAYNIANAIEEVSDVEEVFSLRRDMGWGLVMQEYGITGNPKNRVDDGDPLDEGNPPEESELEDIGEPESNSSGKPEDNPGNKTEDHPGGKPEDNPGNQLEDHPGGKPEDKTSGKPEDTPGGKPDGTGKPETSPGGKPDKTTGKPDKTGKPNK
jgi:hypothetical protein